MIKIDFSKAIPPRLGTYLLAIIPGLFFEASTAIGNPHLAADLISRTRVVYPLGPFGLLVLFLASALFIGHGFFLIAWIVNLVVAFLFARARYALRITFASDWLYGWFSKLRGVPPKNNVFIRTLSKIIQWARERFFSAKARPALKCLHIATRELLRVGYGIDRTFDGYSDDGEWGVWYSAIGKPLPAFKERALSGRIYLACGLAGFTALYYSSPLRMQYFIVLSAVFTFAGCYASVDLARWQFNPVKGTMVRLFSILEELSDAREAQKPDSATVTIDDGENT